ncbi:hypothetical protein NC652_031559 [Populus alba x Populus x berolinensis]|nr:hypothetical protein NC652_031559 [Populus alba x Populus x berolinensis]
MKLPKPLYSGIKICLGRQGQEKFGDELFLFSIIASVLVLVLIGMLLVRNFKCARDEIKNDLKVKKEIRNGKLLRSTN